MQKFKKLFRSALKFGKSKLNARVDAINEGLEEEDVLRVALNVFALLLAFGIAVFVCIILFQFIINNLYLMIIGAFVAAAVYSAIFKLFGVDVGPGSNEDSASIELAEQEAEEVHEDLLDLMYNAVSEAADYTAIQRPRDTYSLETSRNKPYRMDGIMAVHQFEADFSGTPDRSTYDTVMRDLQRRINKHARRYPLLMHNGHPPILYDVKDNGNFLLLEVVLYSEDYSGKIEARKRARIERQYGQERVDDPRYQ